MRGFFMAGFYIGRTYVNKIFFLMKKMIIIIIAFVSISVYSQTDKTVKHEIKLNVGYALGGIPEMPMGQMRKNKAGTIERDYRETGGFVPVGIKEKADDVPAMLSKNEFVMTADAVRGMGEGNVEKGAQKMYDQMKQLEGQA